MNDPQTYTRENSLFKIKGHNCWHAYVGSMVSVLAGTNLHLRKVPSVPSVILCELNQREDNKYQMSYHLALIILYNKEEVKIK